MTTTDLTPLQLPGLELTRCGAQLSGDPDRTQVLAAVGALMDRESMTKWQAGDLVAWLIDQADGDEARVWRELADIGLRQSPAWITSAYTVATAVAPGRRRGSLSFGHHEVVAQLPDVEQDRWLGEAVACGWSIRQLSQATIDAHQPRLDDGEGERRPTRPAWRAPGALARLDRVLAEHPAALVRSDGKVQAWDEDGSVVDVTGRAR